MSRPPEAFMIFKEELKKAQLEKERLKEEYESKIKQFSSDMGLLKEKMAAQEEMMKTALEYAMKLENQLKEFKARVENDDERNSNGYH
ncbi:hypothetical protein [Marinoscillum sp.]|uniref:hypothetical protein n=1 Tax=Marinoscillum sp. TaxID=2024838 RepID=UPI003BAA5A32